MLSLYYILVMALSLATVAWYLPLWGWLWSIYGWLWCILGWCRCISGWFWCILVCFRTIVGLILGAIWRRGTGSRTSSWLINSMGAPRQWAGPRWFDGHLKAIWWIVVAISPKHYENITKTLRKYWTKTRHGFGFPSLSIRSLKAIWMSLESDLMNCKASIT